MACSVTIKPPRIAGQTWRVVAVQGYVIGSDGRRFMTLVDYDQRTLFYSDQLPRAEIAPAIAYAVARAYAQLGGPTASDVRAVSPAFRWRRTTSSSWRACRRASGGRRGRST